MPTRPAAYQVAETSDKLFALRLGATKALDRNVSVRWVYREDELCSAGGGLKLDGAFEEAEIVDAVVDGSTDHALDSERLLVRVRHGAQPENRLTLAWCGEPFGDFQASHVVLTSSSRDLLSLRDQGIEPFGYAIAVE